MFRDCLCCNVKVVIYLSHRVCFYVYMYICVYVCMCVFVYIVCLGVYFRIYRLYYDNTQTRVNDVFISIEA